MKVVVCEETKNNSQKSSVEVIDKEVSVENAKIKRIMETLKLEGVKKYKLLILENGNDNNNISSTATVNF